MARLKRILINKHVVKANLKHDRRDPVISVQESGSVTYGNAIDIIHKGKVIGTFVYRPDKPLKCGASVWFETRADLDIR